MRATTATVAFCCAVLVSEGLAAGGAIGAVKVARATVVPNCTVHVDAASGAGGDGTALKPHKTIAAAVEAAAPGAVICVAEGVYAEQIKAGEKYFTLAGGFQRGKAFKVRDSATYVSKAAGKGGSFFSIEDPGPKGDQLTAIDGFEITGYARAIVREFYESQRFDITNNFIHDNNCANNALVGAGFALSNVSGSIKGNVIARNSCGRGGAGFVNDDVNNNTVSVENNLVDSNAGVEPDASHGGALYLFVRKLSVTGNDIINNSVTQWGAGLFVGAFTEGGKFTDAKMSHNFYRGNRAGNAGGGFFCDEGATCVSEHEVFYKNCGGNILLDSGSTDSGPTTAKFDHLTNVGALGVDCKTPGDGVRIDRFNNKPDAYSFTNSVFWGNGQGRDFAMGCHSEICNKDAINKVSHSMVQTDYVKNGPTVAFGPGIVAPADPLFVAPEKGDFRLQAGSPARGKGNPGGSDLGALSAGAATKTAVSKPASPAAAVPAEVVAPAAEPEPEAEVAAPTPAAPSEDAAAPPVAEVPPAAEPPGEDPAPAPAAKAKPAVTVPKKAPPAPAAQAKPAVPAPPAPAAPPEEAAPAAEAEAEAEPPAPAPPVEQPAPAAEPDVEPAAPAPKVTAGQGASPPVDDVPAKEAFNDAKELGTIEAWNAFLVIYPRGFHAELARAYLKKLTDEQGATPPAKDVEVTPPAAKPDTGKKPGPGAVAPEAAAPVDESAAAPSPEQDKAAPDEGVADAPPPAAPPPVAKAPVAKAPAKVPAGAALAAKVKAVKPAVTRASKYMGFPEKFNRYYTDAAWKPKAVLFVSPNGSGNGATRDTPMSAKAAVAAARPGTQINFARGSYQGCFEFTKENGGTYDDPVVLFAERNEDADQTVGVKLTCCASGRQTCFNFEDADYVAVDGFELIGGKYGVRAIGRGYPASEHSRGIAVLGCMGHDQDNDPFFSGQADWAVWERNSAFGAKKGDGHGIYLSNGGDWNIVRLNETYSNLRSDFQINADPNSTCGEASIPFNDPRCDAYAGEGEGGQGASDYFLVEGNYFHHGATNGPNFTSVRRSVIRNNVFGPFGAHNASFWQETDNPKLGSSDNKIVHNLFITTGRHAVKFEANSTRNTFANNVLLGIQVNGGTVAANPAALLMEVDDTVGENTYRGNAYVSGRMEGREVGEGERAVAEFSSRWFANFPTALNHEANDFKPTAEAPFLGIGTLSPDAPTDRNGAARSGQVDLGPIEVP